MANLYELTATFLQLQQALEEGAETAEELDNLEAMLNGASEDISEKADGYARIVRNMSADAEAIKAEEKRLRARRETIENGIKRLKEAMLENMSMLGTRKLKTSIGCWGIQKNPPSVLVTNQEAIPPQYFTMPEPELKRSMLLAALKEGAEIEGCELQQTEGIRFR